MSETLSIAKESPMAIGGGVSGVVSPTEFAAATSAVTTVAPIAKVLPYLKTLSSWLTYLFRLSLSLVRPLILLSPIPIIAYLFAPVVVFIDIVLTIFIRTPYKTATYLLEALFPLYVLCGVAVITGAIVGLAARGISGVIVTTLSVDRKAGLDTTHDSHGPNAVVNEDLKGKARKVEKVKFES